MRTSHWILTATLLLTASVAHAATITVNATAQEVPMTTNGNCTLAEAITAANINFAVDGCAAGTGTDDTIVLEAVGPYQLTAIDNNNFNGDNGLPRITQDVTIDGNGQTVERVDGSPAFRIFYVNNNTNVTLKNLTIAGGKTETGAGGAGILALGQLTLDHCTLENNSSHSIGGAIWAFHRLVITSSDFSDNSSVQNGGAISISDSDSQIYTITDSLFANNTAEGNGGAFMCGGNLTTVNFDNVFFVNNVAASGGAIMSNCDNLTLTHSTLVSNLSTLSNSVGGGGIILFPAGRATISQSSLIANAATTQGGAISVMNGGILNIDTSTISQGSAQFGSAIAFETRTVPAEMTMQHCTITDNSALNGGAVLIGNNIVINVLDSIFSDNTSAQNGPTCGGAGSIRLGGQNIIFSSDGSDPLTSCTLDAASQAPLNADPLLTHIMESGTPGSMHYEFSADSPAIDAVADCTGYATDQLGKAPYGPCDIGAFEFGSCGDGVAQPSVEECDDGNQNNGDLCLNTCKLAKCSDGFVNSGVEACDDGNTVNTDGCTNTCALPACGDNFVQLGEACDDGNTVDSDSCTNACALPSCGDGIAQFPEDCDDGNQSNTDSCTNVCKVALCGDAFTNGNEQCDDGNTVDNDSCPNNCKAPSCGDGIRQANEACDDGNVTNDDGCSDLCAVESSGDTSTGGSTGGSTDSGATGGSTTAGTDGTTTGGTTAGTTTGSGADTGGSSTGGDSTSGTSTSTGGDASSNTTPDSGTASSESSSTGAASGGCSLIL